MNHEIHQLSDAKLLEQTQLTAREEKAMTLKLLHHLHEVERRRLFAEKACSSLWEFVHRELGYSEAQTSERVNAMRLLFSVPEARSKVESGELTLTSASRIQRFLKTEKKQFGRTYSHEQKIELLEDCAGRSKREVERILLTHSPAQAQVRESHRLVTPELTELKFLANEATIQMLREVQDIQGSTGTAEVFEKALRCYLEQLRKKHNRVVEIAPEGERAVDLKAPQENLITKVARPVTEIKEPCIEDNGPRMESNDLRNEVLPTRRSRHIPAHIQRQVYQRAQGRCEYQDPLTGKRCGSRYRLQFEHRIPFAAGGGHSLDNLALYCGCHNQAAAIRHFGRAKMAAFVPGLG